VDLIFLLDFWMLMFFGMPDSSQAKHFHRHPCANATRALACHSNFVLLHAGLLCATHLTATLHHHRFACDLLHPLWVTQLLFIQLSAFEWRQPALGGIHRRAVPLSPASVGLGVGVWGVHV
jgi:hypothetical protein